MMINIVAHLTTIVVYFWTPCFYKSSSALAAADITDEINSTMENTLKSFEPTFNEQVWWALRT